MKRRLNQFVIIALFILPITVTMGQQRGNGPRADGLRNQFQRGDGSGMIMAIPDLTEEQQGKIKDLHLGLIKESLPIRNQLGENRAKMKSLQTTENPDMKAIEKLIDESAKLEADLQKKRAVKHQEVRKLLTEDQRIMFDSHAGRMRAGADRPSRDGERMQLRQRIHQDDVDN